MKKISAFLSLAFLIFAGNASANVLGANEFLCEMDVSNPAIILQPSGLLEFNRNQVGFPDLSKYQVGLQLLQGLDKVHAAFGVITEYNSVEYYHSLSDLNGWSHYYSNDEGGNQLEVKHEGNNLVLETKYASIGVRKSNFVIPKSLLKLKKGETGLAYWEYSQDEVGFHSDSIKMAPFFTHNGKPLKKGSFVVEMTCRLNKK
jgi:hypothetical protein